MNECETCGTVVQVDEDGCCIYCGNETESDEDDNTDWEN